MALAVIAKTEAAVAVSSLKRFDVVNSEAQQDSPKRKCQDLITDSNVSTELRLKIYEKCLETNGDMNSDNPVDALKVGTVEEDEDFKKVSGIRRPSGGGGIRGGGGGASAKSSSIVTFILMCLVAKFLP